jgi:hypothetical protein
MPGRPLAAAGSWHGLSAYFEDLIVIKFEDLIVIIFFLSDVPEGTFCYHILKRQVCGALFYSIWWGAFFRYLARAAK